MRSDGADSSARYGAVGAAAVGVVQALELFSGLTILPTESRSTASSDSVSDVSRSSSSLRSSSPGCFVVPCTEPRAPLVAEAPLPPTMAEEDVPAQLLEEMLGKSRRWRRSRMPPRRRGTPRRLWKTGRTRRSGRVLRCLGDARRRLFGD